VGALDVLLLDREKIIRRSKETKEFDTVYFSDQTAEDVLKTQKRIPGAIGFSGDFVKIVLQMPADMEEVQFDLEIPKEAEDTFQTRKAQQVGAQLKELLAAFPFDVINLDLEQYLFQPKEQLPGNLTNALRKIFEWQMRKGAAGGQEFDIDEFTLMFTTQVGPKNLPDAYMNFLRDDCLQRNLDDHGELKEPYKKRSKGKDVKSFFEDEFDAAFKLAVPKSLIELALEKDWHIEGEKDGLRVYEFMRDSQDGVYCMLHMTMTVRRQKPDRAHRGPGQQVPAHVQDEHTKAIIRLFNEDPIAVDKIVQGAIKEKLQRDLDLLFEHRKHFFDEEADNA
jgi:hypothetical protein